MPWFYRRTAPAWVWGWSRLTSRRDLLRADGATARLAAMPGLLSGASPDRPF